MKTYFDLLQERQHSPSCRIVAAHTFFNDLDGWNTTAYAVKLYVDGKPVNYLIFCRSLSMMVGEE
jgi:hypothetical protein